LADIYLCHACSCYKIDDGNARAGPRPYMVSRARGFTRDPTTSFPSRAVTCGLVYSTCFFLCLECVLPSSLPPAYLPATLTEIYLCHRPTRAGACAPPSCGWKCPPCSPAACGLPDGSVPSRPRPRPRPRSRSWHAGHSSSLYDLATTLGSWKWWYPLCVLAVTASSAWARVFLVRPLHLLLWRPSCCRSSTARPRRRAGRHATDGALN
jgi:hypothetical protein